MADDPPNDVRGSAEDTGVAQAAELLPLFGPEWWQHLACVLGCVLCAAFAAGLTLGLTSLDEFGLKVLCNRSTEDIDPKANMETRSIAQTKLLREQGYARRILPLVSGSLFGASCRPCLNPSNSHCLLVTLLLANAAANEALPLFLDALVPSWLAVVLSVTVVLIFGEIVPSAIFTGPHQLRLSAAMSPVVCIVKFMCLPIVWPISLVLDRCLGHEEEELSREHMKAMARTLQMQGLERDEVNMIHGVLEMHWKTATDISKPLEKAKMLAHDEIINEQLIATLLSWGHSRVFVYRRDLNDPARRDDIVGVLLSKMLLGIGLNDGRRVDSVHQALKQPVVLGPEDNLLSALNQFQDGMCHLALVSRKPAEFTEALEGGFVAAIETRPSMFCSLEDVIEALLKEDIFDEADEEHGRGPVLLRAGSARSSIFRFIATPRLSRYASSPSRAKGIQPSSEREASEREEPQASV